MRIGLAGLGMVAATHQRAIADTEGVSITALYARDPDKARAFADAHLGGHDGLRIHSDAAALAQDPEVDVLSICTPPNARLDLVTEAAQAGKHLLIEKPIERDQARARALVDICEHAGVHMSVFLQHRMREAAQDMATLLASGTLGQPALIDVQVPWWRPQSYYDVPDRGTFARDGGGVLISQAIHTLDLMLELFGPVTQVQAMARTTALHQMEAEDIVSAGFDFASGAVGTFQASTASFPGGGESITVHGTLGSARLGAGDVTVSFHDGTETTLGTPATSGGGADPMGFTHDWHAAIYADFAAALREGRAPRITGASALPVQGLIDAMLTSSKEGRRIKLPPR